MVGREAHPTGVPCVVLQQQAAGGRGALAWCFSCRRWGASAARARVPELPSRSRANSLSTTTIGYRRARGSTCRSRSTQGGGSTDTTRGCGGQAALPLRTR
uniref:Uncharacterized protein n=1 Tax=Arundo donax TaxID=35708 RepID=A0A0A9GVD8_ARUDO